jgi:hypothetical protein
VKRTRKAKRTAKPAPSFVPSPRDASTLEVIDRRLLRACDLLSCLEHCQDAELNLGALAIATRDLLDRVRDDLAPIRHSVAKVVPL